MCTADAALAVSGGSAVSGRMWPHATPASDSIPWRNPRRATGVGDRHARLPADWSGSRAVPTQHPDQVRGGVIAVGGGDEQDTRQAAALLDRRGGRLAHFGHDRVEAPEAAGARAVEDIHGVRSREADHGDATGAALDAPGTLATVGWIGAPRHVEIRE